MTHFVLEALMPKYSDIRVAVLQNEEGLRKRHGEEKTQMISLNAVYQ